MGQSSRHHGGQSVGGASEEGTLGWTLRWGKVTETGHLLLGPPPGLVQLLGLQMLGLGSAPLSEP